MNDEPYNIIYEFLFEDGNTKVFKILLDPVTISVILPEPESLPEWTKLEYHQCVCCPLSKEKHPYCPVAVNIAELVEEFKDAISSDYCTVTCITPERTYYRKTSIQDGLFSILGIIMATRNCPVLDLFKPMARFHLPFSSVDETIFRSTSVYMLKQYFEYRKGRTPDLELKNLDKHYERVQEVNAGIIKRTGDVAKKDADKNALIILNALAQMLSVEIEDGLNSLEYLFYPSQ